MSYQSWRLIDTGPLSAPQNMSIDESLLCSFNAELSQPVLRLYGWEPAALSIGRFQKIDDVLDLEKCRTDSLPIVRRVSGGGVIFHRDEITYSIVCTATQLSPATSVKESFRALTGFLLRYYQTLGLTASYAIDTALQAERLGMRTAFCFAGKESFDIMIKGKKIGGNAQRRIKNVIFQHGSIPILNHAGTGLGYMNDRAPDHAAGATSLHECGIRADMPTLKFMLVDAFKQHMAAELTTTGLSEGEQQLAHNLCMDKYTTESWNLRGEIA